jgi:hypothetical protein
MLLQDNPKINTFKLSTLTTNASILYVYILVIPMDVNDIRYNDLHMK